ncbi:glycoside hydrolase family protein, partial [Flavobacterium sp.]|uniref:glycoside hydrolase family protein n=1 Tax=Flavobacterium sp. TaxID=239 RepID=UPI0037C163DF
LALKTELAKITEAGAALTLKNAKTKLDTSKTQLAQIKAAPAQTGSDAEDAAWGGTPAAAGRVPAAPKTSLPAGRPGTPTGNLAAKNAATQKTGDTGEAGTKSPNSAAPPKGVKGAIAAAGGNMSDDEIKKMIVAHEGMRTKPYKDSLGLWTVGVGHLIGDGKTLPPEWDREFTKDEVMALFDKDYEEHKRAAESRTPKFDKMTGKGQGAFTDLTFNMGPAWLSKWPKLKAQIEAEDTEGIASNLAGSTWAKQVKSRSNDIIALAEQAFPKMAKGGITEGTSIAGEAGPEAVVPLPDGRTIPVTMDMSQLVTKIDEMIEILREQKENSTHDKMDEMIRVLKDQYSTAEKILQVSA